MEVRQAKVEDAASLLKLNYRLDNETKFMMFEPGERKTTVQQQESILQSFTESKSKVMFVAVENKQVLGFVVGIGNTNNRNKHSMYCVIGVQQISTGKGVGAKLLTDLEDWAVKHGFTRMELTVMCHNERAKRLYQSHGFEIEGVKKQSLCVDGEFVDEYYMGKVLGA